VCAAALAPHHDFLDPVHHYWVGHPWLNILESALFFGVLAFVLLRFGLLAVIIAGRQAASSDFG
jgi:hypothetical protein